MKIIKKGFHYSQDGPGNRLVYHTQGCNMKCPWCANPEGMDIEGCMIVNKEKLLDEVCSLGAIHNGNLDRKKCRICRERECITVHKNSGIRQSFQDIEVKELISEADKSRGLFFDGGGVTISGGEATLQFEELKELLMGLKERGISAALETNGTSKRLEELFPYLDILMIDLKHIEEEAHRKATGISNKMILQNIQKASKNSKELWVRTPLIHGFNDSPEWIPRFAAFFDTCQMENVKLELLLYHEYGKEKWKQCGKVCQVTDGFVKEEVRGAYEQVYRSHHFTVIRT